MYGEQQSTDTRCWVCPYVTVAALTAGEGAVIAPNLLNGEVYVPKKNFTGKVGPGGSGRTSENYVAGRCLPKVINDLKKVSRLATSDERLAGMSIGKIARIAGYPKSVVEWVVSLTGKFTHGENACGFVAQDPGGGGPRVKGPVSLEFMTRAPELSPNSFRAGAGVIGFVRRIGHIKWSTPREAAESLGTRRSPKSGRPVSSATRVGCGLTGALDAREVW